MSVYIKGIEMPMEGMLCIDIFPDGRVAGHYDCTIDWAKAIPVPPHGRLIDADALEQDVQKRLLVCNKNDNQFQKPYEVVRAIALAPTIIPADENSPVYESIKRGLEQAINGETREEKTE